jgi:3',5'-cyclic AMP phosphodiesterase CpdA
MAAVKLAFTADLHLPITKAERLTTLAQEIASFHPDALVIAGDLGETVVDFERCLSLFKQKNSCPIYVLAGNHDLWMQRAIDSRALWLERLPQAVLQTGCHWLEGTSFVLGDTAVAGTIAWYDYSAVDPSIQALEMNFAQEKYQYNADALRIDWEWADAEFAARVAGPFVATLDRLEADPTVRRTIVVTHVPLVEGQMARDPSNKEWAFSNAYFGNLTLGRQVLDRPKVSHIISGHTHIGRECMVTRPKGAPVDARVLASDYERPAWLGLTFEADR